MSKTELRTQSPFLLQYYEKWKKLLQQQTDYSDSIRGDGEYYGLARTGPYSFKSCYVAFRDNTKWCATVLTKAKMPWGEEKRFLFQNHAVSMCERSDGTYVSEDEAFFVAGIFNLGLVERFIYASSDNRSFKIRPPIYVPLYKPSNPIHKSIARFARQAAKNVGTRASVMQQLETAYIHLCKER